VHAITEQTYYRWKAKYGGMDGGEAPCGVSWYFLVYRNAPCPLQNLRRRYDKDCEVGALLSKDRRWIRRVRILDLCKGLEVYQSPCGKKSAFFSAPALPLQ
jgi:hypothetical protein